MPLKPFFFDENPNNCVIALSDDDLIRYPTNVLTNCKYIYTRNVNHFKWENHSLDKLLVDRQWLFNTSSVCWFLEYFKSLMAEYKFRFDEDHPVNFMSDSMERTLGGRHNGPQYELNHPVDSCFDFSHCVNYKGKIKESSYFLNGKKSLSVIATHRYNYTINLKDNAKYTKREKPTWLSVYEQKTDIPERVELAVDVNPEPPPARAVRRFQTYHETIGNPPEIVAGMGAALGNTIDVGDARVFLDTDRHVYNTQQIHQHRRVTEIHPLPDWFTLPNTGD